MEKKILIINGSPRNNGLTNNLIRIFKEKIALLNKEQVEHDHPHINIEHVNLAEFNIQHCNACDQCLRKPYECPHTKNDDMGILHQKLVEADGIIFASPSYFANVSGIMKNLIDRTRPLKMNKYQLKNKFFSPIVSSGLRAGGINLVQDVLIQYALIQGMIIVGALGHPVLMANLPSECGQKFELTDFRKPSEISNVSKANIEALADRFYDLLA